MIERIARLFVPFVEKGYLSFFSWALTVSAISGLTKNHWHPAFCGATEWELKKNKKDLEFEPEHQLSKEPLRMDMLVIKKNTDAG